MAITIGKRPERIIASGADSALNSVVTSMPYTMSSNLSPLNTFDDALTGGVVQYDSAKRKTEIRSSFAPTFFFVPFDYVLITNSGIAELDGKYFQITEVFNNGAISQALYIDVNIGAKTSDTCNYQKHYNNYSAKVKVFGGFPQSHPKSLDGTKPMVEIDEQEVFFYRENGVNVGKIDTSKVVASQLNSKFIASEDEVTNNINLSSMVTIEVAESYEVSDGNSASIVTRDYFADVFLSDPSDYYKGLVNPSFNTPDGFGWIVAPYDNATGSVSTEFVEGGFLINYDKYIDANNSNSPILYQATTLESINSYSGSVGIHIHEVNQSLNVKLRGLNGLGVWVIIKEWSGFTTGDAHLLTFDTSEVLENLFAIGVTCSHVDAVSTNNYSISVVDLNVSGFVGLNNSDFAAGLAWWNVAPIQGSNAENITPENNGADYWIQFENLGASTPLSRLMYQSATLFKNTVNTIKIEYELTSSSAAVSVRLHAGYEGESQAPRVIASNVLTSNGVGTLEFEFSPYTNVTLLGVSVTTSNGEAGSYYLNIHNFQVFNSYSDYVVKYVAGLYGTNQFQNVDGGNMGQNLLTDISSIATEYQPEIITDFEEVRVVEGVDTYFNAYVSEVALTYDAPLMIQALVYDNNGDLLTGVDLSEVTNQGYGVYLSQVNVQEKLALAGISSSLWSYMMVSYGVSISSPPQSYQLTKAKRYNNHKSCGDGVNELRWLNKKGGWETWHFNHNTMEEDINSDFLFIEHDTFQSLGNDFSTGDTTEELVSLSSRRQLTLYTDWLTEAEVVGLQNLRHSIKVQVLVAGASWQTVKIEASTVVKIDRTKKLRELSFKMKLPKTLTQSL